MAISGMFVIILVTLTGEEIETAWKSGFVYNKNCAVYNNEDLSLSLRIGLCNPAKWFIKL